MTPEARTSQRSAADAADRAPARRNRLRLLESLKRLDWLVLLPPIAIAIICAGHFQKPHSDFPAFWLGGEAILHADFPTALLRPPVYPLLIAGVGRVLPDSFPWPEYPRPQAAAALINGMLLPVNTLMVWLLTRRLVGRTGAAWTAAAFAVVPAGLELTGHCLVEPLLLSLMLAAVVCAPRSPRAAWLLAGLAALTRYDAAGALAGLFWLECWRGTRPAVAAARLSLAAAPLLLWLAITFSYWRLIGAGHYLTQIGEARVFQPGEFAQTVHDAIFAPGVWATPFWLSGQVEHIQVAALLAFWVLAAIGAWRLFVSQRQVIAFVLCTFGGYAAVHTVFPFQFVRFGYVIAPIALLFAAAGAQQVLVSAKRSRAILVAIGDAVVVVAGALFIAELERFNASAPIRSPLATALSLTCLALLVAATLGTHASRGFVIAPVLLGWYAMYSVRATAGAMGDGRQREDYVAAMRWVATFAQENARVTCNAPGMAALYAGYERRGCFVDLSELKAADPAALRDECSDRRVAWLLWHEAELRESGGRYIDAARLRRFEHWPAAAVAGGWRIAAEFEPRPHTWVLTPTPVRR